MNEISDPIDIMSFLKEQLEYQESPYFCPLHSDIGIQVKSIYIINTYHGGGNAEVIDVDGNGKEEAFPCLKSKFYVKHAIAFPMRVAGWWVIPLPVFQTFNQYHLLAISDQLLEQLTYWVGGKVEDENRITQHLARFRHVTYADPGVEIPETSNPPIQGNLMN